MRYQELLNHYPPADMVEETDPEYPLLEADGGCRVCARGEPCRERIETDVADILTAVGLPQSEQARCLLWLWEQGASSLFRSILEMAEEFSRERD